MGIPNDILIYHTEELPIRICKFKDDKRSRRSVKILIIKVDLSQ